MQEELVVYKKPLFKIQNNKMLVIINNLKLKYKNLGNKTNY
jgi:hypothetical protein